MPRRGRVNSGNMGLFKQQLMVVNSRMLLLCGQIWNHPDILHQIISQRKDDNDLDIDDAKTADVASASTVKASSARSSRAKSGRFTSAASSASLASSASTSRLAASTDSLTISTCGNLPTVPSTDSLMSMPRLSATPSASSLISMSRLNLTPSTDSLMSEASRAGVDVGKFDFPDTASELTQLSGIRNVLPAYGSGSVMSENSQHASEKVKFTMGNGTDISVPESCGGMATDMKHLLPGVDSRVGMPSTRSDLFAVKSEDSMLKNMDTRSERDEMMKMILNDMPVKSSDLATDGKFSSASLPLGDTDAQASAEMKPDLDKPGMAADAVATSNVSSTSSTAAATTSSSATAGGEITAVASASDLKKESQAINYDWVSLFLLLMFGLCK